MKALICCLPLLLSLTGWAQTESRDDATPTLEIDFGGSDTALSLPNDDTFSIDFPDESTYSILKSVKTLQELNVDIPAELKQFRTSIKLRRVTWRQVFQVCLEPIGYAYLEYKSGQIRIMSKEAMDALALEIYQFSFEFVSPKESYEFYESLIDESAGEKATFRDSELEALIHPCKYQVLAERIDRIDSPNGLPNFPDVIYWPKQLPEHFNRMLQARADIKGAPIATSIFLVDDISVTHMKTRLTQLASEHGLKLNIQEDRISNCLIITGIPLRPKEYTIGTDGSSVSRSPDDFRALIDYLDDAQWYHPKSDE